MLITHIATVRRIRMNTTAGIALFSESILWILNFQCEKISQGYLRFSFKVDHSERKKVISLWELFIYLAPGKWNTHTERLWQEEGNLITFTSHVSRKWEKHFHFAHFSRSGSLKSEIHQHNLSTAGRKSCLKIARQYS